MHTRLGVCDLIVDLLRSVFVSLASPLNTQSRAACHAIWRRRGARRDRRGARAHRRGEAAVPVLQGRVQGRRLADDQGATRQPREGGQDLEEGEDDSHAGHAREEAERLRDENAQLVKATAVAVEERIGKAVEACLAFDANIIRSYPPSTLVGVYTVQRPSAS